MKIQIKRNYILIWLGCNLFVMTVQLVLMTANQAWDTRQLIHWWAYSLVYANLTCVPALLILPNLLERLALRRVSILPMMIAGVLFFVATGCLAAQALLWGTGQVVPRHFWLEYLRLLPVALSISLVFALGAFFYESLQERLRDAEEKLHEKEVMEERIQKLAAEARLHSLESRLHPHFLFNTLNSISSLIEENPALAEQTVGRLAALLRSSLETTNQSLIPLRQELSFIEDYLEIEKVRFGDKLRGRIDASEEVKNVKVPSLSILSLVENAVKHGISPQRKGGEVLVVAFGEAQHDKLVVEVRDTGPGFNLAAVQPGHGLDNLVGRLNALFGDEAHLRVFPRDGWCVVQMVLPGLRLWLPMYAFLTYKCRTSTVLRF
jgi:sensor histidine kinase YesM